MCHFIPAPRVQPPTNEGTYSGNKLHLGQSAIFKQQIYHEVCLYQVQAKTTGRFNIRVRYEDIFKYMIHNLVIWKNNCNLHALLQDMVSEENIHQYFSSDQMQLNNAISMHVTRYLFIDWLIYSFIYLLTHWGQDKWLTFSRWHFQMNFD